VRLRVDEYKKLYHCPQCFNETPADTSMDPVTQNHTEGDITGGGGTNCYDRSKYLETWLLKVPPAFFREHNVCHRTLFKQTKACVSVSSPARR